MYWPTYWRMISSRRFCLSAFRSVKIMMSVRTNSPTDKMIGIISHISHPLLKHLRYMLHEFPIIGEYCIGLWTRFESAIFSLLARCGRIHQRSPHADMACSYHILSATISYVENLGRFYL